MLRKMVVHALLAVAAVALQVASASAIDLTGTWTDERSTCRQLLPTGEVVRFKDNQVVVENMNITQFGDGSMNVAQGSFNYRGRAYAKGSNPATRGEGFIDKCDSPVPDDQAGWRIKNAKTFPPDSNGVTGAMKVELFHAHKSSFGDSFEVCQVRFARSSTTNPNVAACP